MIKNIGKNDKLIRMIAGFLLAVLFMFNIISGVLGWIALVVAVILIGTSFMNFCPAYLPLGINTCKKQD